MESCDQEHQDAHVVAVGQGAHDTVVEDVGQRPLEMEVGVQQTAHQDAHEQGGVDLLRDQSEADGDDGGQQRPEGLIETGGSFRVRLALGEGEGGGKQQQNEQDGQQGQDLSCVSHGGLLSHSG